MSVTGELVWLHFQIDVNNQDKFTESSEGHQRIGCYVVWLGSVGGQFIGGKGIWTARKCHYHYSLIFGYLNRLVFFAFSFWNMLVIHRCEELPKSTRFILCTFSLCLYIMCNPRRFLDSWAPGTVDNADYRFSFWYYAKLPGYSWCMKSLGFQWYCFLQISKRDILKFT